MKPASYYRKLSLKFYLRAMISQMYTARDFRRYREYEALKREFRKVWSERHDR